MTANPCPAGSRRRGGALALAVLATFAGGVAAPAARAAGPAVPASQALVVLHADHAVRARPSLRARRIESVAGRRPLTRVRTILPVLGVATSDRGRSWIRVRLPGRPNGHTGWIRADRTRRTSTDWHVAVRLTERRVTVYRAGKVVRRFRAVVGTPSTPTPTGSYFVEEAVALAPYASGAPFALAASARSEVLQEFAGGPGQIALHGTAGVPGALGTAASHGCVRLSTAAITWLARRVGSGVPLTITR